MGGGDLNAKKAWHPNTLKNQERVWKAEQAAAEEKKRIVELERERLLERERAELNKLAKSNMAHSSLTGDDRLHWMYEKPDKKVQQEEYLLGKAIDKNHEQAGKSEGDEIPAVSRRVVGSSMLTVSGDTQVDLARKMREDPLLLVKERERAARAALLNNPVQRARLTELLRKEQIKKKESKKKKKKSKDLDNILAEKLQALSGKKGIDLASLLVSDDSSSESSDEKSKKKKKKKKKKSKSKSDTSDDSDLAEQRHKTKHESKNKHRSDNQKSDTIESDSFSIKRKKRQHSIEKQSAKLHVTKHDSDSSENQHSSADLRHDKFLEKHKHKFKHSSKNYNSSPAKRPTTGSDYVASKRKKRYVSTENESTELYVKKRHRDSSEDHQSSDEQKSRDDALIKTKSKYVKEDRYWSHKQYSSDYRKRKAEDQDTRDESHSKGESKRKERSSEGQKDKYLKDNQHKYEREDRLKDTRIQRNRGHFEDEKDKRLFRENVSALDKSWRSNKQSGLSEAEKAAKLAEMMAAGAEREKQREKRVADQLAEKETEERPSTHSRSRNVIHQLPDSLESRIHSNRHYIQRDQRHMNENFARR